MTSLEHTNNINLAAIISPAEQTAQQPRHLVAPTISHTPCIVSGCNNIIAHLGELSIRMCDYCLDVLSGDVETYVPRRRTVNIENDETWSGYGRQREREEAESKHDSVDIDDFVVSAPKKLRDEIFSGPVKAAEQDSAATPATAPDVDAKVLCATCVNMTEHRCKCGKLCCYECCDEAGRCPSCDGEEV